MMIWGVTEVEGWFFTNKWLYYQKRVGMASSYVEMYYGYYRVHVTYSGQLGMCDIEYRSESLSEAFEKAEELLEKYKDKEKREFWTDYYSPHNPGGYWQTIYHKKTIDK